MKIKGYSCMIAAAALWGFIGPVSKIAFQEGVAPLEVAFWRAAITWVFFGIHAMLAGRVRVERRDVPVLFVFGVTGITLFYGSYQMAVHTGGAALSAVLLYTAPAWVAVMSGIIFKERMTPLKLAALVLTLVGVFGVSLGTTAVSSPIVCHVGPSALIYGLSAGFFYALYYIFGKYFSHRYDSSTLFFYILPIGALSLLPWVVFTHKSPGAWASLVFLSLFSTYGAYFLYYAGLRYLEPTRAAMTATLEPVVAAVVSFFMWKESFHIVGYAGSTLILTAVILMMREDAPAVKNQNISSG